jgi:hypothetical protein
MVSRAPVPPERTFEQEIDHQWSLMEKVVEQLESCPRKRVRLPQLPETEAVETDCRYQRGGQQVYQRQLAIHRAAASEMLIFTCSSPHPFSDEQKDYWQRLCSELSLAQ